jgi:hypothetical protein
MFGIESRIHERSRFTFKFKAFEDSASKAVYDSHAEVASSVLQTNFTLSTVD